MPGPSGDPFNVNIEGRREECRNYMKGAVATGEDHAQDGAATNEVNV